MQPVTLRLFPGGKQKALTISYDDGRCADQRLVDILNQHHLKATFNLNSTFIGREDNVKKDQVAPLYQGHEVATHSAQHPTLTLVPRDQVVAQIVRDRWDLERIVGYPVRGHSYPNGGFNDDVAHTLQTLGIAYARTTWSHGLFHLPENPLLWHPTFHHKDNLLERAQQFKEMDPRYRPQLFYVWGHSYEFDNDDNWNLIEEFAQYISNDDAIWYATNIEIIDYLAAFYRLVTSYDGTIIYNPSAIPVWVWVADQPHEIQPGATLCL